MIIDKYKFVQFKKSTKLWKPLKYVIRYIMCSFTCVLRTDLGLDMIVFI